jgi:tight adherence protein C
MVPATLVVLIVAGSLFAAVVSWNRLVLRHRSQARWTESYGRDDREPRADPQVGSAARDERRGLALWLYRAGYRRPDAARLFCLATLACTGVGLAIAAAFRFSSLQSLMERTVVLVPGGVGETFLPVVWIAPWLLFVMIACAPWLIVRQARRTRIEMVEQDLPLALELLSTLAEAGLGFDAALTRILKTRLAGRPLAAELQVFQADLLAGRSRVESLRRLSSRLDLHSASILVSALVQAEQLGVGIARVLRQQADDVRSRRRERAIAFANSLQVKRVIPLVVCFLPGLFVWTLGPAFVQLFKMSETFIRVRNF